MELGIEIIDLRTKQNVLDYMENYEVEVPIIEKRDDYEEDDYVPCSETGLSNKEIVTTSSKFNFADLKRFFCSVLN